MRYSYGDLLREDRPYDIIFRIWPGTIRILLWGDPVLAGGYGRNSIFCGSQGVELCEPLSFKGRMGTGIPGSRTGYQDKYLTCRHDWQKFEYTYRVWGRSLYNPEAEPEAFQRFLEAKFGEAADSCGRAIASASRILPLITLAHTPTASNNSYWPEMYENMSIVHEAPNLPYGYELPRPARFGTVGACDPQLFMSPSDFAACIHGGQSIRKLSPLTWANWLEQHATDAAVEMAHALAEAGNPATELYLISVDITILAAIGRFFADKIRAAVFWEYYLLSGAARSARQAIDHYLKARDAWAEAATVCQDDLCARYHVRSSLLAAWPMGRPIAGNQEGPVRHGGRCCGRPIDASGCGHARNPPGRANPELVNVPTAPLPTFAPEEFRPRRGDRNLARPVRRIAARRQAPLSPCQSVGTLVQHKHDMAGWRIQNINTRELHKYT